MRMLDDGDMFAMMAGSVKLLGWRMQQQQQSDQKQAAISRLPVEILHLILAHLNYPGLSSFLDSCHLFRCSASDSFVHGVRESYVEDLLAREQSDAGYRLMCAQNLMRYCMHAPTNFNDIHRNRTQKADALVCYSCYSELPRERFCRSQITGSRSYGHGQARRRFCIACGLRQGKWVPGTYFNRRNGGLIVCILCRDLKATGQEAKASRLCYDCHEQQQHAQNQFRLSYQSDEGTTSSAERSEDEVSESEISVPSSASSFEQDFGTPSSASSLEPDVSDLSREATHLRKEVICRRCWIVDHSVTTISVGMAGWSEKSLCDECTNAK